MNNHNQKGLSAIRLRRTAGFGLIEVLLIIIVAGIVGFGGYYVWYTQHNKDTSTSAENSNSTNSSSSTSAKQFVFKELGVQITLPDSLKDLSYIHGSGDISVMTTPEFNRTKGSCSIDGFSTVFKETGQFNSSTPREGSSGLLKQFDKFYIAYGDPVFGAGLDPVCEPVYQNITNMQDKLTASLKEAFKTAALTQ